MWCVARHGVPCCWPLLSALDDEIVDDREEVVPPEKSFRFQKNVREKDMEPWTKEGALDPGSAF
ncbi:MAG: hypothetical protein IPG92_09270 [Flavobacteriales bacterium]|nr:hypothetical protein [Flavobacteriales bacterium]